MLARHKLKSGVETTVLANRFPTASLRVSHRKDPTMNLELEPGRNIAIKIPAHEYENTVRFYQ